MRRENVGNEELVGRRVTNFDKNDEISLVNAEPVSAPTEAIKEVNKMKITMTIEGMMCSHCEGRVKKTIEAQPGVISVEVSHTLGTAVIVGEGLDVEAIKAALEAQDYPVISIS
jgi:copper chaperone CopZ